MDGGGTVDARAIARARGSNRAHVRGARALHQSRDGRSENLAARKVLHLRLGIAQVSRTTMMKALTTAELTTQNYILLQN